MKKWKAGIALVLALAVTGCGNAANNAGNAAGNAAGWAGNTVGNAIRGTGNAIGQAGNALGNAAGQAGNAAGNAARWGTNRVTDWTNRGGTQSVQFHPTTRTVDIRLSGTSARANARGGVAAGDMRGANVAGNWSAASTITVPVGWKVRVTAPSGAAWASNVYIVPYHGAASNRAGAFATGTPNTGTWTGPNWNGTRAGGTVRQGAAVPGGVSLAHGQTFTAAQPGHYAIVVSGNGYMNRLVDLVNVTNQSTAPSITTNYAW
jgi:hypothetical protein